MIHRKSNSDKDLYRNKKIWKNISIRGNLFLAWERDIIVILLEIQRN